MPCSLVPRRKMKNARFFINNLEKMHWPKSEQIKSLSKKLNCLIAISISNFFVIQLQNSNFAMSICLKVLTTEDFIEQIQVACNKHDSRNDSMRGFSCNILIVLLWMCFNTSVLNVESVLSYSLSGFQKLRSAKFITEIRFYTTVTL